MKIIMDNIMDRIVGELAHRTNTDPVNMKTMVTNMFTKKSAIISGSVLVMILRGESLDSVAFDFFMPRMAPNPDYEWNTGMRTDTIGYLKHFIHLYSSKVSTADLELLNIIITEMKIPEFIFHQFNYDSFNFYKNMFDGTSLYIEDIDSIITTKICAYPQSFAEISDYVMFKYGEQIKKHSGCSNCKDGKI